jgi:hypothetical protein
MQIINIAKLVACDIAIVGIDLAIEVVDPEENLVRKLKFLL